MKCDFEYAQAMQSVKHFMLDSGWRHADLAKALGVHYSYISLLLAGKREPSLPLVKKIAEVTQIPVETLVAESGKPPPKKKRYRCLP